MILILDIETSPNTAYVWRLFKETVSIPQLISSSELLSFSAKIYGTNTVITKSRRHFSEKKLLEEVSELLDKAQVVVAHNGMKFDIPFLNSRFAIHKMKPPSPYKVVDTFLVARKHFRFTSNKLEYLAKILGVGHKSDHKKYPGFDLWVGCVNGEEDAFLELEKYNAVDTEILEGVYKALLPWIKDHPNLSTMRGGGELACPKCGSTSSHKRGTVTLTAGVYQQYRCNSCGGWHRGRENLLHVRDRKFITVNIA